MDIYGTCWSTVFHWLGKHVNQEDQAISLVLVIVWLLEGDLAHIGISLSICSKNAIENNIPSLLSSCYNRENGQSPLKGQSLHMSL